MSNDNNRLRIIHILKILTKYSNIDNPINISFIIDKLSLVSIKATRHTIYQDISSLNKLGFDIIFNQNLGYFIVEKYQDIELKIIIDAINSSNFLSNKRSIKLIDKLLSDCSIYQINKLSNHNYINPNKIKNDSIVYNIDTLLVSINNDNRISFNYYDLDINHNKVFRKNKKEYSVIPYAMVFHNQFYYLVCYIEQYKSFSNYRIDKIANITLLDKVVKIPFDLNDHVSRTIDMYVKEKTSITLKCDRSMSNAIIDKFGSNALISKVTDEYFIANINIDPSITFIGWLVNYQTKVKVIKPQSVIDDIINTLNSITNNYLDS